MRTITVITISILFTIVSYGQTQLLKDYDFDKGGYTLLGVRSESDRNGLADTIRDFYTDDIEVLNLFKKKWVFKKPSPQYACGYHYIIAVCKNGLKVESFYINLNCNEIATDKGYFYFDAQKLRMFKDKLKKIVVKKEEFSSLAEARAGRTKILSQKNLIMTETPNWTKYEGEFNFTYTCPKGSRDCLDNQKKLLKQLTEEIKKAYPNELFELKDVGGSKSELFVEVRCNKSLAEEFSLYPLSWKKWEAYWLELRSYWTTE